MDKLVMLKSSRYGLEIHLNPQAEFSKLLREMERKLKASIKFFEGAKMAVEFKDRLLSQAEEDQLLELISKTAGIDVVCIIDRNQTKEMAYKSVIEPTNPNSSPIIAKIKSVCGSKIKFPFFTDVVASLLYPFPFNCPDPIAITEFSC